MGDKFFNIVGALVTVAGIFVVVSNKESAKVIGAMGDAFAGSIRAATGKG